MITIQVMFFATIRAIIGVKEIEVSLPQNSTVDDLKQRIIDRYPQAGPSMDSMLVSVNRVFTNENLVLSDQTQVAFFPHISGG